MELEAEVQEIRIAPQSGPQEGFLSTSADIAVYGGAAGAGKTFAILLEALRHTPHVKEFAAMYFRRNTTQIRNPGGLWDASLKLFPLTGARPVQHVLEWHWPDGGKVKMGHLEHESSVLDWQGSEIPLIVFDELTHFSETQFFYMLSRSRSMCGVRPYVRATCNPDADSWVAKFLEWWIDQETGFPIAERSGKIRWFLRRSDILIWADTREELFERFKDPSLPDDHNSQPRPKSVTFIPGKLSDNKALMEADPDYLSNLQALSVVEQARLLGGNWKIRPSAGLYFRRSWVELVDAAPADMEIVRYWDLASTEKTPTNDPDWTVGVKLGKCRKTGIYYWLHSERLQGSPLTVETTVKNTAIADGKSVRVRVPQDPGQAGKSQAGSYTRLLSGFIISTQREHGDKVVRFSAASAQFQAGNIKVVRGPWVEDSFKILEAFPSPSVHDDDVDAFSGAFAMFHEDGTGYLEFMARQAAEKKARENGQAN